MTWDEMIERKEAAYQEAIHPASLVEVDRLLRRSARLMCLSAACFAVALAAQIIGWATA